MGVQPGEKMAITLDVNGSPNPADGDTSTPLLWVLRDHLQLTGTKYGCGVAACSACVVLSNGSLVKTCNSAVSNFLRSKIVTIEGLSALPVAGSSGVDGEALQKMWVEVQVPQCGFCQSGILLATYALLKRVAKPSDADINAAIGNLCACGTYPRIRAAIKRLTNQPVDA
jgi:isoquinoline 1-oxidoreductase subunit alpha